MQKASDADGALFAAVWTFHRAIGDVIDPLLSRVGITKAQFVLLFFIEKMPQQVVGKTADMLSVRMSTVSHLVNDLEGRGYLKRERSSDDRRVVRLQATSRGSKLIASIEGLVIEQVRAASSGIAGQRKADAAKLLNEVASHILGTPVHRGALRIPRPRAPSAPKRKRKDRSDRG